MPQYVFDKEGGSLSMSFEDTSIPVPHSTKLQVEFNDGKDTYKFSGGCVTSFVIHNYYKEGFNRTFDFLQEYRKSDKVIEKIVDFFWEYRAKEKSGDIGFLLKRVMGHYE
jgi:hypothetical protein